jgi:arginine decarboxylase
VGKQIFEQWSIEKSDSLYGISEWGADYFSLNSAGELCIQTEVQGKKIRSSLANIIENLSDRGLTMPLILRISNILDEQIKRINSSFQKAIDQSGYKSKYQGVFPIKVNQQEQVIDEICRFGKKYNLGLEAGSKAELILALSMINSTDSAIICNGYKDEEFIQLGLFARKMGYNCFFVLESPSELPLILKTSEELGIDPQLGVRIKLSSQNSGYWQDSAGDNSIFGLSTAQVIDVVDELKSQNKLDYLQLLHYHIGSQIPNIRDIRTAVQETCRFYVGLIEEGAPMGYLDLGGGLAVDYDGSKANYMHSKNYGIDEYCADIIEIVMGILDERSINHPILITESGRALVSYSSILLFNILDANTWERSLDNYEVRADLDEMILNLIHAKEHLTVRNLQETFNDVNYYREQILDRFNLGQINLRDRSFAEGIYVNTIYKIKELKQKVSRLPKELDTLDDAIYDIYYGNFSVFQSLPDSWAIGQIFPCIPIHRHLEEPKRRAIIADMTCDSDGKIDNFAHIHGTSGTLAVHELKDDEEYYMGVFLIGAYQETLGDLHNLFGDTHVVSIEINSDGEFTLVKEVQGDSIADVISYVEYDPQSVLDNFQHRAELAVKDKRITTSEQKQIIEHYKSNLQGYTYFER